VKIGIISDIHANHENLWRALVLLREHGAETILCAGDLVDGETEGDTAAGLVKAQAIPCVQGNHDHAMSRPTSAPYVEWLKEWKETIFGSRQTYDNLTDVTLDYLRELPLRQCFEWEGTRVMVTHASTWDQVTYIYPFSRRHNFYRIAKEADADAVILGHTHLPMAVQVKSVWVFNPGSVDGNRDEPFNSTCAILEVPTMAYQVYDIDTGHPVHYARNRFN
jgi:putative phosphoesterase